MTAKKKQTTGYVVGNEKQTTARDVLMVIIGVTTLVIIAIAVIDIFKSFEWLTYEGKLASKIYMMAYDLSYSFRRVFAWVWLLSFFTDKREMFTDVYTAGKYWGMKIVELILIIASFGVIQSVSELDYNLSMLIYYGEAGFYDIISNMFVEFLIVAFFIWLYNNKMVKKIYKDSKNEEGESDIESNIDGFGVFVHPNTFKEPAYAFGRLFAQFDKKFGERFPTDEEKKRGTEDTTPKNDNVIILPQRDETAQKTEDVKDNNSDSTVVDTEVDYF
ncbi:MAG: hypothetical protein PHC62_00160 [Candidatus Izemoplasmatales bacterium]|nr:hypothetical protein [Candidatus Izemoplasmatales bacterium]